MTRENELHEILDPATEEQAGQAFGPPWICVTCGRYVESCQDSDCGLAALRRELAALSSPGAPTPTERKCHAMRQIYKFAVPIEDEFTIQMPKGAQLLRAMVQGVGGQPQLWAMVDPDRAIAPRTFRLYGTGHHIPDLVVSELAFVDTFMLDDGHLVFHLFELRGMAGS